MPHAAGNWLGSIVQPAKRNLVKLLAACALLLAAAGCAQNQYKYGVQHRTSAHIPTQANRISVGGDHPGVDRFERIVQAPRRLVRRVFKQDADDPSDETLEADRQDAIATASEYLAVNGLDDVYIDVQRYEPAEQWKRLRANDRMSPAWKYTGGTLNWIGYTLLPSRAFHSDQYSPYTNTLSLNSTKSTNSLYEAAQAKQFLRQRYLGSYAMLQRLPVAPLWHHGKIATDVLTYARVYDDWEFEEQLYVKTYSKLGGAAVSEAMVVMPTLSDGPVYEGMAVQLAGGITGKTIGKTVSQHQKKQRDSTH